MCSTGVIGVPLPLEKILRALPVIARHRRPSARSFAELSLAICTTDTRPKTAASSFKMAGKRIHFVGCAKGAGMIHPNMATMLAFVITDAAIAPGAAAKDLARSDLANFQRYFHRWRYFHQRHAAGVGQRRRRAPAHQVRVRGSQGIHEALEDVCRSLALQIVADGEGAQRVIEIEVRGAKSESCGATHRGNYRHFSVGEDSICRRRSKLGAHFRGCGTIGSQV